MVGAGSGAATFSEFDKNRNALDGGARLNLDLYSTLISHINSIPKYLDLTQPWSVIAVYSLSNRFVIHYWINCLVQHI